MRAIRKVIGNIPWLLPLFFSLMLGTSVLTDNIYIILVFCVVAAVYVPVLKYKDATAVWILLFSIIYLLIVILEVPRTPYSLLLSYLFAPVIFYLFGRYVITCYDSVSQIITFLVLSVAIFGSMTYYYTLVDMQKVGLVNISRVFEADNNALAATLYGLSVSLGFTGITIFFSNKSIGKFNSFLLLICLVMSILTVVHLVNRTGLAVLAGCFVACLAYYFKNKKGKIFSSIIIGTIVIYLFTNSLIDDKIINAYISRDEGIQSVAGAGGRSFRWLDAIQKLWFYPTGWYNDVFTYRAYAHNLWLDIARVSGVFAFSCFMIVTVRALKNLFALVRKTKPNALVLLIVILNTAFFLSSFVEPVIEGFPLYFYLYLMLWGIQKQVYLDREKIGLSK